MIAVVVFVAVAGLAAVALLAYGHLRTRGPVWAYLGPGAYQEATVIINRRYRPETIRVRQGVPVRLHFVRREDNPCSERVVFSAFGVDRRLPAFQETSVEFIPTRAGTFLFTCHWGMYRGKLVVTAPRDRPKVAPTIKLKDNHGRDQR